MIQINTFVNVELLEMLHGSSVLKTAFSTSEKDVWEEELRQVVLENGVIAYNAKQKLTFSQNLISYSQMKGAMAFNSAESFSFLANLYRWKFCYVGVGKQLIQVNGLKK